jgi:hypothetical protein
MPEMINIKKFRAADQRFGLVFMPSKTGYARAVGIQKERRMDYGKGA